MPDLRSGLVERDAAGFWIATRPVSTGEFRAYCRQAIGNNCKFRNDLPDNAPALGMRWSDAQGYADWLSGASGRRFTLPTHVQLARVYAEKLGTSAFEFFDAKFDDRDGVQRRVALSPYYQRDLNRGSVALLEGERHELVGFRLVEWREDRQ